MLSEYANGKEMLSEYTNAHMLSEHANKLER